MSVKVILGTLTSGSKDLYIRSYRRRGGRNASLMFAHVSGRVTKLDQPKPNCRGENFGDVRGDGSKRKR